MCSSLQLSIVSPKFPGEVIGVEAEAVEGGFDQAHSIDDSDFGVADGSFSHEAFFEKAGFEHGEIAFGAVVTVKQAGRLDARPGLVDAQP